jgi:hypothetical protein
MNPSVRFCGALAIFAGVLTASAEASAPAGRYLTSGGTVTDTKTKLIWQQIVSSSTYTWANAPAYCQTVGATLGGTGWRLPTIKELQTIVDYSRSGASIDPIAFPATPQAPFWSSSVMAGSPSNVWTVSFIYGNPSLFGAVGYGLNVRCVR